jgi:hypothetical protein
MYMSLLLFVIGVTAADQTIAASSNLVRFVGRTEKTSNDGVTFDWEGVYATISVAFPFSYVVVNISDHCQGTSVGGGSRWGVTMQSTNQTTAAHHHRIQTFYSGPLVQLYYLFTNPSMKCDPNCAMGNVTLVLWRLTESRLSGCTATSGLVVNSFTTDGTFIHPPSPKKRRMEFVGDSITAGDLTDNGQVKGGGPDIVCANAAFNDDITNTVGAILCNPETGFDADCMFTAWGGITLGTPEQGWGMRHLYPSAFSSSGQGTEYGAWNFSAFPVDAIVINLGTNDFPIPDPATLWVDTYVQFVDDIVFTYYKNPNMTVFLAYGPMVASYEPYVKEIARIIESRGINVATINLLLPHKLSGCYGHPSLPDNVEQAANVKSTIAQIMGW